MHTIYVEESILDHPRTQRILQRFSEQTEVIPCQHYGEVFNVKAQNFRLQKQKPALILANKTGKRVLPTPEGFGIGSQQNFYFSHMLNCLYDCRYCFLQGMYQSANYLAFVNYEDFMREIVDASNQYENAYFFSGYDCDSLAFEPVTHFLQEFLPFFAAHPKATLELRTKSANISALLNHPPFANCVVGFSFTPDIISQAVEHKVPSVSKRINAMQQVAEAGWRVGLRFDPMIWAENFEDIYSKLIDDIFTKITPQQIHSVSVGPLRFPAKMHQKIVKLYPDDKLMAHPLHKRDNHFSYDDQLETKMKKIVVEYLQQYLNEALIFECSPL